MLQWCTISSSFGVSSGRFPLNKNNNQRHALYSHISYLNAADHHVYVHGTKYGLSEFMDILTLPEDCQIYPLSLDRMIGINTLNWQTDDWYNTLNWQTALIKKYIAKTRAG